ncbi:MAG: ParB N-terminal domain-containing protein [Candidatus Paceibacterota bacterium]
MKSATKSLAIVNWSLVEVPIKSLREHSKNPRQIGKEQFARLGNLIDKFGLIDKPIVNADMMLIGGHQRVKYLKKQKVKVVECWVADRLLDEKEVEELMIGVNKIHGQFDFDILANMFDPIDLLKWGFSEKELLDTCQEAEEILEEQQQEEKKRKDKLCPNCGHSL